MTSRILDVSTLDWEIVGTWCLIAVICVVLSEDKCHIVGVSEERRQGSSWFMVGWICTFHSFACELSFEEESRRRIVNNDMFSQNRWQLNLKMIFLCLYGEFLSCMLLLYITLM